MSFQELAAAPPPPEPAAAPTAADAQALMARLPWRELSAFAKWFEDWFEDEWDRQIERDALAGRLDHLTRQADADFEAGRCRPL